MKKLLASAALATGVALGGGAALASADSPAAVTRPTFSEGAFTGPNISVVNFPAVSVQIIGPSIVHPGDPVLPPNPIHPIIEVTSLLHD